MTNLHDLGEKASRDLFDYIHLYAKYSQSVDFQKLHTYSQTICESPSHRDFNDVIIGK